ncbi:molybdopterin oxidoreductase, molybdopterin-binding subunit [Deferribacter desulfuricans SSM1]|uniref:Molybdopterin oxidoreductase, molybdopterin-binding subunit n=1 Tax=Deferribacter desulfuricans (strain DSM 14783 / JCM 11476 / NBRC 101012 / SSM1) TaxID=639282 RepID=D3PC27_DEFDS|nr:molybdopterin-dependent oxidoreductase [Deferribacter desulfuricans]BAI80150.1 molybdopterin oxidoreductase, molybdopterin-binding subunit [Deferribacter desulfuricans SSM1]
MGLKLNRRTFLKSTALISSAVLANSGVLMANNSEKRNKSREYGLKKIHTWCEMCFWGCGVTALKRNGKVFKLEGQEKCPNNYGKLCAKGNAGVYQLYDPDRLKSPMIRTGERGSGKFKEVSWEEAYNYIAEKVKKISDYYGSKSLALIAHGSGEHAFISLLEALGSHNIAIPAYSQCMGSREIGWWLTYGMGFTGHEYGDGEHSKCMMFLGRNILEALQVGEAKKVIDGLSKGAKLIYVDPRYSKTAAKADYWLQIKPGTDLALLLGMINFIIENKLYNEDFVKKYCYGFDELKKEVKQYTLEWTSRETEIPAKQIAEVCYELAKAAPQCFIHPGRRLTRYGNDTQTVRAIGILNALFGNWGMPGGFYVPVAMKIKTPHMYELEEEHGKHKFERVDGAGEKYKLAPKNLGRENGLFEAILTGKPYPIKGLFVYGTNFFEHYPDNKVAKKIANSLDLLVTCEIYMTETALYSDVILPESTYLERWDPITIQADKYPFIQYREPASVKLFNTKGAWEIASELAKTMNLKIKYKTVQEYNKEFLKTIGISEDVLKRDGCYVFPVKKGMYPQAEGKELKFRTMSRKIELYSKFLDRLGFDPIPKYTKAPNPAPDEFRLLFGRMSYHTHARTQNNRWLLALHNFDVKLWIHPKRAAQLGITDGAKVRIRKGDKVSDELTAYVTDLIHPECIFIPHGFGRFSKFMKYAYEMKGASDAEFCSNGVDPISGAAAFHNGFVKVERV